MNGTVDREITRIAVERMGSRPASLASKVSEIRTGTGRVTVLKLTHSMLTGTAYADPGMPDAVEGERLTELGRARVADAIDDISRRLARAEARTRLPMHANASRPWIEDHEPPSWTLLSHPVMVHALMRAGANDLPAVGSSAATPGPGVRVKRLQDLLVGTCPLDPLDPSRGRAYCDDMGFAMEIADAIPHVARVALIGHPIGALVELPACGDADLDAVVGELFIASIVDTVVNDRPGIMVTLSAATWLPCAPPPPRVNVTAMRTPPKTC